MLNPEMQRVDAEIKSNQPLAALTTLGVGGPSRWFTRVANQSQLEEALDFARRQSGPVLFMGEGSNVLFPDEGFSGLVIQNGVLGIDRSGLEVIVGGGENLCELIRWLNSHRLQGMEKMYGIPGSVAGAVVGNAGAYGQEISDCVVEASLFCASGMVRLDASQLGFHYRHSLLKENRDWFLLNCTLRLKRGGDDLQEISNEILNKRFEKYPPGLKCPGSYFKNVIAAELPPEVLRRIPSDFIQFGKIPAGKLLEAVGALGARRGDAQVAPYHGNLIINCGHASSRDVRLLAEKYAERVWQRFRIRLEPEILIVENLIP
ncbi:MAG: UDP-N-acetylmuramate dehydrogenase [Acidobacteria bacterium]|nr:UDP-N-acetylmuramate dehydrogenase [Acidobacteriota bacterium]